MMSLSLLAGRNVAYCALENVLRIFHIKFVCMHGSIGRGPGVSRTPLENHK